MCLLAAWGQGPQTTDVARIEGSVALLVALTLVLRRVVPCRGRGDPEFCRARPGTYVVGRGFAWTEGTSARLYERLRGPPVNPLRATDDRGDPRLHGLGRERSLSLTYAQRSGNTLVLGAPGSGKTFWIGSLIEQDIACGQCVLVLDPKGDRELERKMRGGAQRHGRPYVYFHLGHPAHSCRFDALSEANRTSELASRIVRLLPASDGSSPFVAFSWMVLEAIGEGLRLQGEPITLATLHRHVLERGRTLAASMLEERVRQRGPFPQLHVSRGRARSSQENQEAWFASLVAAYRRDRCTEPTIDKILAVAEHDLGHYGKMVATLLPLLGGLTSGELRGLLSPEEGSDPRPIWNIDLLCRPGTVAYVGLDTLADPFVGQAVGSLFLGELAALAARRYAHGQDADPVQVYVDEAGETAGTALIQLLNKGRGGGFHLTLCLQTLSDLAARLGGEAPARVVVGNTTQLVVFRVRDGFTQRFCSEQFGREDVPVARVARTISRGRDSQGHGHRSGSHSRSVGAERRERIPPDLLGTLPTGHFIASLAGGRLVKARTLSTPPT